MPAFLTPYQHPPSGGMGRGPYSPFAIIVISIVVTSPISISPFLTKKLYPRISCRLSPRTSYLLLPGTSYHLLPRISYYLLPSRSHYLLPGTSLYEKRLLVLFDQQALQLFIAAKPHSPAIIVNMVVMSPISISPLPLASAALLL